MTEHSCDTMGALDIDEPGTAGTVPALADTYRGGIDVPNSTRRPYPVEPFDPWEFKGAPVPVTRAGDVLPLADFDDERRLDIALAVLDPLPPEKYIYFGPPARPYTYMESRAWYEWHWHRGIDPDRKRRSLPSWKRQAVIDRDGLTCGICGDPVKRPDIHIDHIFPVALGGTDDIANLQVAHSLCNLKKGATV